MAFNVALETIPLIAPLARHLLEEGGFNQPVEFVGVHRVNAVIEPLAFGFKPPDRLVVFAAFLGVACVKSVAHPLEHLVIEMKPPEQVRELLLKRLLSHVLAAASCRVPTTLIGITGAMIIDVFLLLNFAHDWAAAGATFNQTREGEIAPPSPHLAADPPLKYVFNPFPKVA